MKREFRFGLLISAVEKQALDRLAEAEGALTRAATVRRLIRIEARKRGLWPSRSGNDWHKQEGLHG